jgi:phosphocarrier protein HPr
MPEVRAVVGAKQGLHARPAAAVVHAAQAQPVPVTIGRPGGDLVNAKSMLLVVSLGIGGGEEVVLHAEGDGADEALARVAAVIERDHDAASQAAPPQGLPATT